MGKSVKLFSSDTVTTVTTPVKKGEIVVVTCEQEVFNIVAAEDIPIYHKIALVDIHKHSDIIKYGEVIGIATQDIPAGSLVHTHNLSSKCQVE